MPPSHNWIVVTSSQGARYRAHSIKHACGILFIYDEEPSVLDSIHDLQSMPAGLMQVLPLRQCAGVAEPKDGFDLQQDEVPDDREHLLQACTVRRCDVHVHSPFA